MTAVCKFFLQGHCKKGSSSSTTSYQPHRTHQQTAHPVALSNSNAPKAPSDQDFVQMILNDLSERPFSWHFSSPYALFTTQSFSVPIREFGNTEYSFEELRLQAYAEARMTGGRIDNYKSVVESIKQRAEMATKMSIPRLNEIVSEARRMTPSNFDFNPSPNPQQNNPFPDSISHSHTNNANNYTNTHSQSSLNLNSRSLSGSNLKSSYSNDNLQSQSQQLPSTISYSPSQTIIPDSHFVFGQIPEMPPE